jgi:hypothetical protein
MIMAEEKGKLSRVMWYLALGFIVACVFWVFSIMGMLPLTYTSVKTPNDLEEFMDSPRDNLRGVKVNGHFLEMGKRPSLQILKDYDEYMFLMRPYRQIQLKTRNLTRPEVHDFCTNITGEGLEELRAKVISRKGYTSAWSGKSNEQKIELIKATMFSYLVVGLSSKPIFITQVDLAKRLGMDDEMIMKRIVTVQRQWYSDLLASQSMDKTYPFTFAIPLKDALIVWLDEQKDDPEANAGKS